MRKVRDRLNGPFQEHLFDFIQQQRQNNRGHKTENQIDHAHSQRVAQHPPKAVVREQKLEMLEAHPFLLGEIPGRFVILKSHRPSPDRDVSKQYDISEQRYRHINQLSLAFDDGPRQRLFFSLFHVPDSASFR
ncbi:hypothetical protein D1872_255840 [compost metagenome]